MNHPSTSRFRSSEGKSRFDNSPQCLSKVLPRNKLNAPCLTESRLLQAFMAHSGSLPVPIQTAFSRPRGPVSGLESTNLNR